MLKKVLLTLAFLAAVPFFIATTPQPAADGPKLPTPKPVDAKPTVADYKNVYLKYAKWHNNLANDKFYDSMYQFKDKKTGVVKKLADLPEFDKQLFYAMQVELLSKTMEQLQEKWTANMKSLPSVTDSDIEEDNNLREAKKEDVEAILLQLNVLQKKVAEKQEAMVEKLFKDHAKEFTDEERDLYIKNMRERNDRNKLIERNK
jgi:hypothetical protein